MPDITATRLELTVDAYAAAMLAWCYPSDVEIRYTAMQACALLSIDYLEAVAVVMEGTGCDPATGRRRVADSIGRAVGALCAAGAVPREGVTVSGQRADGLGRAVEDDE